MEKLQTKIILALGKNLPNTSIFDLKTTMEKLFILNDQAEFTFTIDLPNLFDSTWIYQEIYLGQQRGSIFLIFFQPHPELGVAY
ncbi:hypothetical protein OUZ56_033568 [Daphnia magna]|uniref:Uncharacterized protein n=1 Tax=Daphnia magna TaxID=35525 RepID=A0ABQ9ZXZ8_9CRUS|nr:hypothetical protein OUZ56_033568 [Daphnia magna]